MSRNPYIYTGRTRRVLSSLRAAFPPPHLHMPRVNTCPRRICQTAIERATFSQRNAPRSDAIPFYATCPSLCHVASYLPRIKNAPRSQKATRHVLPLLATCPKSHSDSAYQGYASRKSILPQFHHSMNNPRPIQKGGCYNTPSLQKIPSPESLRKPGIYTLATQYPNHSSWPTNGYLLLLGLRLNSETAYVSGTRISQNQTPRSSTFI